MADLLWKKVWDLVEQLEEPMQVIESPRLLVADRLTQLFYILIFGITIC